MIRYEFKLLNIFKVGQEYDVQFKVTMHISYGLFWLWQRKEVYYKRVIGKGFVYRDVNVGGLIPIDHPMYEFVGMKVFVFEYGKTKYDPFQR